MNVTAAIHAALLASIRLSRPASVNPGEMTTGFADITHDIRASRADTLRVERQRECQ
jgi:hypothetical protein